MRERTYIAAIMSLDVMLILTGAAMAWINSIPAVPGVVGHGSTVGMAAISTGLIALVGAWMIYEMNVFALRLAEWRSTERSSKIAAAAFALATLLGGISGLTL